MKKLLISLLAIFAMIIILSSCDMQIIFHRHREQTIPRVEPTCSKAGKSEGSKCAICDKILVPQRTIPPIEHDWDRGTTNSEPTCEQPGEMIYTCEECGEIETEEILPLGHNIVNYTSQKSTCTTQGWEEYEACRRCNYSTYKRLPLAEHTWDNGTVKEEPACGSEGLMLYTCELCSETKTVPINPLMHDIETHDAKVPTCTEIGWEAYENCTRCSYTTYKELSSTGHLWDDGKIENAPTCSQTGTRLFTCMNSGCKDTKTERIFATNDHSFTSDDICENCGTYRYTEGLELALAKSGNEYTVAGIGDATDARIVIPTIYNGLPVTKINAGAFKNCTEITEVIVGKSVLSIGYSAFGGCNSLESITLPFVGERSGQNTANVYFKYIFGVASDIPASLKTVTITDVTKIKSSAFSYCENIRKINLPNSLLVIESQAFIECSSLESIIIPDSVTKIGSAAFKECGSLKSINVPVGLTEISSSMLEDCVSLQSITFHEKITSIGNYAFSGCKSLVSLTLPKGVASIGEAAFENCILLECAEILCDSPTLGKGIFAGCESLNTLTLPHAKRNLLNYFNIDSSDTRKIPQSLETVIISGGETVCNNMFYGCKGLVNIYLPNTIKTVSRNSFYNCPSLKKLVIPDSVQTIARGAISACESLESITLPFLGMSRDSETDTHIGHIFGTYSYENNQKYLPKSLRSVTVTSALKIADNAFWGCETLENVGFGASCEINIGYDAFSGCKSLKAVYIENLEKWCTGSFYDDMSNTFYYADELYLCGELLTDLVIPASVIKISDNAFCRYKNLKSITIPSTVEEIGISFRNCTSLESIVFEDNSLVESITGFTFSGCQSLENVDFGENGRLKNIWWLAFSDCTSLTSIELPASLEFIEKEAFMNCPKLVEVINRSPALSIVAGQTENGYVAFYAKQVISDPKDSKLINQDNFVFYLDNGTNYLVSYEGKESELVLPETINGESYKIYPYAFADKKDITSVIIPFGISEIGESAFDNCEDLESITIPSSIVKIGSDAFSSAKSLNSVNISSVSAWCAIEFENGSSNPLSHAHSLYLDGEILRELVIPDTITEIKSHAFYACTSIETVTLGTGLAEGSISANSFSGCYSIVTIINYSSIDIKLAEYTNGSIGYYAKHVISSDGEKGRFIDRDGYRFFNLGDEYYLMKYKGSESALVLPDNIEGAKYSVNNHAFLQSHTLVSIVISDGVKHIGESAFAGCENLESVIFEENQSLKTIGSSAFAGCKNLKHLTLNEGLINIEYNAFYYCSSITELLIPSTVSEIGAAAFANCTGVEKLQFAENSCLLSIYKSAFQYCELLTSIVIPDSVVHIGYGAFECCNGLTSITIPFVGEYSYGGGATNFDYIFGFEDTPKFLKTVIITNEDVICENAFRYEMIESITIPVSVKYIEKNAFCYCDLLEKIVYTGTKSQWSFMDKEFDWDLNTGDYTVYCTDGTVAKTVY